MIVAEGLDFRRVYWTAGHVKRDGLSRFRPEVKDPPCSGWQHAFLILGEKLTTIFCPYSMESHQVTNSSQEVATAAEPAEWRPDVMPKIILDRWAMHGRLQMRADYDVAALVLKRLGVEVPMIVGKEAQEDVEDQESKGGKDPAETLLKAVKPDGKRGKFLKWWLEKGRCSIRECMAEFGMTRSNVLSYLYALNKDHGIGYDLKGDSAELVLPDGCEDPFKEDDSWLE